MFSWGCDLIRGYNHKLNLQESGSKMIGERIGDGEIYVGGVDTSVKKKILSYGFTHIIHLVKPDEKLDDDIRMNVKELTLSDIRDTEKENIIKVLPTCFEFLDSAFQENRRSKVLIHCLAGISRSVSVCIGYLMRKNKLSFNDTLKIVKVDRRDASPNRGFSDQLRMFEWNGFKIDQKLISMSKVLCDTEQGEEFTECEYELDGDDFLEIEKIAASRSRKK